MNIPAALEQLGVPLKVLLSLGLIAAVGFIDWVTGFELSFSLFYVAPILLTTWYLGKWAGVIASVISAMVWLWADYAAGQVYSHPLIPLWNSMIRFAFYILLTVLLAMLRQAMQREQSAARSDDLTGAVNRRLFSELSGNELDRLRRYGHPFSLAYIDLDNFKQVNDSFGHARGDQVLCTVTAHAKAILRTLDVFARLGGDEFAILLPETGEQAARIVAEKLQANLLQEFHRMNLPVTLSIGILTCNNPPATVIELINIADGLMYEVKRSGKNAIGYLAH